MQKNEWHTLNNMSTQNTGSACKGLKQALQGNVIRNAEDTFFSWIAILVQLLTSHLNKIS